MKLSSNHLVTGLPQDDGELSGEAAFSRILDAAWNRWIPLYPWSELYPFMGHMIALGKKSLTVNLSYEPNRDQIWPKVIVAHPVGETVDIFHNPIYPTPAAWPKTKTTRDLGPSVVTAQLNGDRPVREEEIPSVVQCVAFLSYAVTEQSLPAVVVKHF